MNRIDKWIVSNVKCDTTIDYARFLPMQTQSMQESRQAFHQYENADGEDAPEWENGPQCNTAKPALLNESLFQDHVPQHLGQFCIWK